jgi:O-antigen ligase
MRGAAGIVVVYVLALVLIPSRYTISGYDLTLAMLVSVVAGLAWFARFVTVGSDVASGPVGRALILFGSVTIVSYLVTVAGPSPVAAISAADRRLVAVVGLLAVAFVMIDGIRTGADIERVITALVAAGAVAAAIGILQFVTESVWVGSLRPPGFTSTGPVGFILERSGVPRVAGTARHPIEFGLVMAMLLPFAAHRAVCAPTNTRRVGAYVSAGLMTVALVMSLSRSAVLALVAVVAVLLPSWPRGRRVAFVVWSALGFCALTLAAGDLMESQREALFGDAAEGSNQARTTAAGEAFDLFAEQPVIGQGLGGIQDLVVDNQYLQTLAESGLIGFVSLLVLLNAVLLSVRRIRATTAEPAARDLARCLAASLAAFAVGSFALATLVYPTTAGLLVVVAGLTGALYRSVAAPATEQPELADVVL